MTKIYSLRIEAKDADGTQRSFDVRYKVNIFGRAKLLNENELPSELVGKYQNTLLAAFISNADYDIVKTNDGWRLKDREGKIYQYEFTIELPDGTKGIPFKESMFSDLLRFIDMRNTGLSRLLNGAIIRIAVNEVSVDIPNSSFEEITTVFRQFKLRNIDGSNSCAYTNSSSMPMPNATYSITEHNGQQQRWLNLRYLYSQRGFISVFDRFYSRTDSRLSDQFFISRERARGGGLPKESIPAASQQLYSTMPLDEELLEKDFGGKGSPQCLMDNLPALKNSEAAYKAEGVFLGVEKRETIHGEREGSNLSYASRSENSAVPLSSLTSFKAVIFDLDGIVVDSEKAHLQTFNQTLAPLGIKIAERYWKRSYTGTGSRSIMEDVFTRNGMKESVSEWVAKRVEIYQKFVEKHGLPEISGFKNFNSYLVSQGVATAVASGGHNSHIQASLQSLGLPKMLFVGQENVSRPKPAPDLFLLAAKRLKAKPSECIVFEDSHVGIEAARRAGMPCIALSTTLPKKEIRGKAALIVSNFRSPALKKLLARLIRKRR